MNTAKQIKTIPACKRTKKQKAIVKLYEDIKSGQSIVKKTKLEIESGKPLMWNTPVAEAIEWVKAKELEIASQIASLELLVG